MSWILAKTIYDIENPKDELIEFAVQSVTTKTLSYRKTLKNQKLEQMDSVPMV